MRVPLSPIMAHGIWAEVAPLGSVTAAGHSRRRSSLEEAAESIASLSALLTRETFLDGKTGIKIVHVVMLIYKAVEAK